MAKDNNISTGDARRMQQAAAVPAPHIMWSKDGDGWLPRIFIANIVIPLTTRPFQGFYKGERDAAMVFVKQALTSVLFDTPCYLINEETQKFAVNPEWEQLPFFAWDPAGEWRAVEAVPTAAQIRAGAEIIDLSR